MPALGLAAWFDQAFGTEANQVLPAGQDQGFVDQPVVFGVPAQRERWLRLQTDFPRR